MATKVFSMTKNLLLILILIYFLGVSSPASSQSNNSIGLQTLEQIRSDPKLRFQLQELVKVAITQAFGESAKLPKDLDPIFQKPLPLFVTAKKSGEVRGCMGNLKPKRGSLAQEILTNLRLAFFQDPRHRSIREDEISGMEIYLTAVGDPVLIRDFSAINPARDAVLVRHGNKEGVVLPGEAKTLSYLLAFAKAKAGIKKGEPFQVYRIPTQTMKVVMSTKFVDW